MIIGEDEAAARSAFDRGFSMKENQKRLLVSLVAGSALSLTLGITVHADGIDETEPVTIQTASLSPGEENKENAIEAGTHEGSV